MRSELNPMQRRALVAMAVVWLMIGALGTRLWYLQGIRGAYYRDQSENNRTRTIRTTAPRGYIFDRENRVLVRNRPSFDIALMLEDTPDVEGTIERIAQITGRPAAELKEQLASRKQRRHFEPQIVLADASREELAKIKAHTYRLPGVIVDVLPTRAYPYKTAAPHILGYVREISRKQLAKRKGKGYRLGDKLGQAGLELTWEEVLRGKSGYVQVEVDARGNRRGELGIVDNIPGNDLHLTLDIDLQLAAEAALGEQHGAVVALDPNTGEVLALVSSPGYDANIFSGKVSAEQWKELSTDKAKPLRNRAIADNYPSGSTFKLIMAVAGLTEGKVHSGSKYKCPGYYFLGRRWHCHKRSGHGTITLRQAVQMSCNVYFYHLGQMLGPDIIVRYARAFGLGEPLGIELPGEIGGLVPSRAWKKRRFKERWYPGDTIPLSIGQGFLSVTPLQMAVSVAAIANSGTVYRPYLVRRTVQRATGEVREYLPKILKTVKAKPAIWKAVRSFAVDVVNTEKGTGKRAALDGITVGGKTGTAQIGALHRELKDHAWFVGFAPAEKPTIAIATVVEYGGHGGVTAAPVARAVMEVHFRKKGMLKEPEKPKNAQGQSRAQPAVTTGADSSQELDSHA